MFTKGCDLLLPAKLCDEFVDNIKDASMCVTWLAAKCRHVETGGGKQSTPVAVGVYPLADYQTYGTYMQTFVLYLRIFYGNASDKMRK